MNAPQKVTTKVVIQPEYTNVDLGDRDNWIMSNLDKLCDYYVALGAHDTEHSSFTEFCDVQYDCELTEEADPEDEYRIHDAEAGDDSDE
jgi:hypothetical protein